MTENYQLTQKLVDQIEQAVSINLAPVCFDIDFSKRFIKQECKKLYDFINQVKEPGTEHRVEYNTETKLFDIYFIPMKPIKVIEETCK